MKENGREKKIQKRRLKYVYKWVFTIYGKTLNWGLLCNILKGGVSLHKFGKNAQTPLELWGSGQDTPSTFTLANLLLKLHTTAK